MDRPLRFCMITTFYPPYNFGGDGIFVHRLSNELARRGHRVDVIHCTDAYRIVAGRNPSDVYQNHPNVTIHGLKSAFGFLSPLATQQTGLPLFKSADILRVLKQGFTRLNLLVSPKVQIADDAAVIETVMEALGRSSVAADLARAHWLQAKTLRVKRMEPIWTARGKLMPLHLARRSERPGGVPAVRRPATPKT